MKYLDIRMNGSKLCCTVNTITLEGDFKEKANYIIKEICDVDNYTWM